MSKSSITIGLLAHVDAGKTTLTEALLYNAGVTRGLGRVDRGDAFLDIYELEKKRGITIFSKQAVLDADEDFRIILMDTPGHVDFSSEMERALAVLDYAILIVSAADGIQGHTRILMKLLSEYDVPCFIFVNKMDQAGADKEGLLSELVGEFGDGVVDFSDDEITNSDLNDKADKAKDAGVAFGLSESTLESIAMLDEKVMESYLENGEIETEEIRELILERRLFPCFFGSALKNDGIDYFYKNICELIDKNIWLDSMENTDENSVSNSSVSKENKVQNIEETKKINEGKGSNIAKENNQFSGVVYKITHDSKGMRLTHIRVTEGELHPRQTIDEGDTSEKVGELRLYSGEKFELLDATRAGDICAVTGLKNSYAGQGLGGEEDLEAPITTPVLELALILPENVSAGEFLPGLREIEEELPELGVIYEEETGEIHIRVMGKVQTEVLYEIVRERYGVEIGFGESQIVYRETVKKAALGIGHFEPLRHYAEVHLGLEPAERGSGIIIASAVSEDELALNWQRLICTHLLERDHPGVLTGAPLTDVKITVVGGRAHLKHTEGGDFRQATYRAVRNGLMKAECELLEPYYSFEISVPQESVGRVMTDIERMSGSFTLEQDTEINGADVENQSADTGNVSRALLVGTAPVSEMQSYPAELAKITGGEGEISLNFHGYLPAHDAEKIIEGSGYDPLTDEDNPTGSVFCAHGAGYYVPWDEVEEHAHVTSGWRPPADEGVSGNDTQYDDDAEGYGDLMHRMDAGLGAEEIDAILSQATGSNRRSAGRSRRRIHEKLVRQAKAPTGQAKPAKKREKIGDYLLVDGYNVIHAWESLREYTKDDMEQARGKLLDTLCNYQGYTGQEVIAVFDAYRVAGHPTETFDYHNIHVVFTKTAETADQYIEKFSHEKADRYHVTVVTSDGLEQIIVRGAGAHLLSARDFEEEVARVAEG